MWAMIVNNSVIFPQDDELEAKPTAICARNCASKHEETLLICPGSAKLSVFFKKFTFYPDLKLIKSSTSENRAVEECVLTIIRTKQRGN